MDPNANLEEQRRIVARIFTLADSEFFGTRENRKLLAQDAERLAELAEALDVWISRGGFLPAAWQRSGKGF